MHSWLTVSAQFIGKNKESGAHGGELQAPGCEEQQVRFSVCLFFLNI